MATQKRLRELSADYRENLMFDTSLFFSDKLLLANDDPHENFEDIKNHIVLLFHLGRHKELLFFLSKNALLFDFSLCKNSRRIRNLESARKAAFFHMMAAKSSNNLKNYSQTISILNESARTIFDIFYGCQQLFVENDDSKETDLLKKCLASVCVERAKALEGLENRKVAVKWFVHALGLDLLCVEAFDRLIERKMLSVSDENTLISAYLNVPHKDSWIKDYYGKKLTFSSFSNAPRESAADSSAKENAKKATLSMLPKVETTSDWVLCEASSLFNKSRYKECLMVTERAIKEQFGMNLKIAEYHIGCLYAVGKKNELFLFAHKMVRSQPDKAATWFAVGTYYLMVKNHQSAKTFFGLTLIFAM